MRTEALHPDVFEVAAVVPTHAGVTAVHDAGFIASAGNVIKPNLPASGWRIDDGPANKTKLATRNIGCFITECVKNIVTDRSKFTLEGDLQPTVDESELAVFAFAFAFRIEALHPDVFDVAAVVQTHAGVTAVHNAGFIARAGNVIKPNLPASGWRIDDGPTNKTKLATRNIGCFITEFIKNVVTDRSKFTLEGDLQPTVDESEIAVCRECFAFGEALHPDVFEVAAVVPTHAGVTAVHNAGFIAGAGNVIKPNSPASGWNIIDEQPTNKTKLATRNIGCFAT